MIMGVYRMKKRMDRLYFVKGDIKVLRNGVLTDTLNNLYPSDHCPVMATLIIQ